MNSLLMNWMRVGEKGRTPGGALSLGEGGGYNLLSVSCVYYVLLTLDTELCNQIRQAVVSELCDCWIKVSSQFKLRHQGHY